MIHVCYGLHDKDGRYSKFTGTSMLSLFENVSYPPPSVVVHILHDNTLTQDNRDKFVYIAGRYGQAVKFYNVEQLCADKIEELKNLIPTINNARVSIGAFYRLLMKNVLPEDVEKVIYFDSDILVNLDLSELWKINLADKTLAAVPEKDADPVGFPTISKGHYLIQSQAISYEDYFNSAVMLINLRKLRNESETLRQGIIFRAEHPQCICFDQDILNYCFTNNYVKLPSKFDQFVARSVERFQKNIPPRKVIYHYTGPDPKLDMSDTLNRLYFEYFSKTPWFNADIIGHLYEGVRKIFIERQNFAMQVSAAMSGKERAFFVAPENIDGLKGIFSIGDSEEIITAGESFQNLIDSMKKSRGKKIFFIFVGDFRAVGFELTKAGFVEGKDFLNALAFLSDAHGIPFDSYPLVKIM